MFFDWRAYLDTPISASVELSLSTDEASLILALLVELDGRPWLLDNVVLSPSESDEYDTLLSNLLAKMIT